MSTAASLTTVRLPKNVLPEHWTLADVRRHLGGVPLDRIRLYPPPGMATEEDVLEIEHREDRLFELVDGILVEKAVSTYESVLACLLIQCINNYLERNPLGIVSGGDGQLWILPGRLRVPDVAFIRWERFPRRKLPRARVFEVVPDLAVEILSPRNTRKEMQLKLHEYFRAGTSLVWYIDPKRHTATIYTSPDDFIEIDENGVLDGRDVLPGFRLKLRKLFERAPRE